MYEENSDGWAQQTWEVSFLWHDGHFDVECNLSVSHIWYDDSPQEAPKRQAGDGCHAHGTRAGEGVAGTRAAGAGAGEARSTRSKTTDTVRHHMEYPEQQWTHAHLDKASWGDGPWQQEPDKVQWVDAATGLDCLAHRGLAGAWCGYVGVPEGHPDFKRDYNDVPVSVHGGLTYADLCQENPDPCEGICHVPYEGRPDHVWWLGFDCAHAGDLSPRFDRRLPSLLEYNTYRTLDYVKAECAQLARQLKDRETQG